jgi:formylglycine-generating enzyme required for sulfatase activity
MRSTILLVILAALFAACADEPAQDATTAGPTWLTDRPENAHPYADETLARFAKLVEGDGWRDAAWNAQGTLEPVHEKTGSTFVLIPAGSFLMGSPASEAGRLVTETQHEVTVPAFLLCKTECTQRAWVRGGGSNSSHSKGDSLPVECMSWDDCQGWCKKLGLRLPSESEWEYACRAGTETPFATGETLTTDQANYDGNYPYGGGRKGEYRQRTVLAGSLPANSWGLHEMHGNVWEWCEDWYEESYEESYDKTPRDGSAHTASGSGFRVLRGGGLNDDAMACRSALRFRLSPGSRYGLTGFRPAADLPR